MAVLSCQCGHAKSITAVLYPPSSMEPLPMFNGSDCIDWVAYKRTNELITQSDSFLCSVHDGDIQAMAANQNSLAISSGDLVDLVSSSGSATIYPRTMSSLPSFKLVFEQTYLIPGLGPLIFNRRARARYQNSPSYRHIYRPWRSRTFWCQHCGFHRHISKSKSCPSWGLHRRTINSRWRRWSSPRSYLWRTRRNGSKHILLLLDEPTNHLDLGAVVWLEAYLSTYNHILVIVSHSQDFLDSICTNIMDLTHKKKMVYYAGKYSTYVKTKRENEVNQMK